ncbi:MAG: hypothetical protein O7D29_03435 [Gemmatimonadetes bacterium]|nr:hypothetical protein [Gemmatimonadota bacterium]
MWERGRWEVRQAVGGRERKTVEDGEWGGQGVKQGRRSVNLAAPVFKICLE